MGGGSITSYFLIWALGGGEWSASCRGLSFPGIKASGTQCIEAWLDLRAGLDAIEKRKTYVLAGNPTSIPQCNQ
jgi:hypothetical protein